MAFEDMAAAQFENVNGLRMYPFTDTSSLSGRNGKELGKDVIVDVHMVVPADVKNPESGMSSSNIPSVRLTSVHLSPSMVSACFVSIVSGEMDALSVTVHRENFRPYITYRLEKLSGSQDIGGIVTFGDISFPGFPENIFLDGAYIHPCCIAVAKPPMLRSFFDPRSGERISGDAEITFSGYVDASKSGRSFALSLKDGAASELASECAKITGSEACGATPIRSINGVYPDEDGNIVLWFH